MIKNETGNRFGDLLVIAFNGIGSWGQAEWTCTCNCGKPFIADGPSLRKGRSVSCGCKRFGQSKTHGQSRTKLYGVWKAMKKRCYNQSDKGWANYGGRGITVCDRWRTDFSAFADDMTPGYASGLEIERSDNNLGYGPGNCIWATKIQQSNNRRNNRVIEFGGNRLTASQWARKLGLKRTTIIGRLNKGLTPNEVLATQ